MNYSRVLERIIEANLFKNKTIILFGARRVGKTTLSKKLISKISESRYINCELIQNKIILENQNSEILKDFLGNYKLIVLDEAQHISNIGLTLNIINDTFPEIQIIATGSSSFDLSNKISEPLTGRSRVYTMFPLSIEELLQSLDKLDVNARLSNILRFGLYPEVYKKSDDEAKEELYNIASNYLYKDILQFERIKKADLIFNLLKAISLQLGNEVSYNELSRILGVNLHTIKRYIELLEKSFIIFRLNSFSRNLRKEIGQSQKIYFYDIGIRNTLIQNFNHYESRTDIGGIWENFCIAERLKHNQNNRKFVNSYFWRTYDQKEIDYIEESEGVIKAYEIKFNPSKKSKFPDEFLKTYSNSSYETINNLNYLKFVTGNI